MLTDVVIANKTYAKMVVSTGATLDEIAVKVIKQDIPDFLLPVKMLNIDGETEFRYEIGEGIRLKYLPDSMSKKDFMILLENMIRPFQICNDWFLDYHCFCLDSNYIIVGKNYSSVRYIYIPDDEHAQSEDDILEFFRDFIINVNLSDEPAYVMNLYRHLKEKNSSLVSMLDYLAHETGDNKGSTVEEGVPLTQEGKKKPFIEMGKEFINNKGWEIADAQKPREGTTSVKAKEPEGYNPPVEFDKRDVKGELISNLFGDMQDAEPKKTGKTPKAEKIPKESNNKGFLGSIFGGGKGKTDKENVNKIVSTPKQNLQLTREEPRQMQSVASNSYYEAEDVTFIGEVESSVEDGTKLTLQLEEDRGYQFPKYIEIDLGKGHATVGRFDKAGNAQSDYNFDASLSFVSRRHFRLEKDRNQYRIIDLGSGNGTMLNNEILVPNMSYQLRVGDRIVISKNHKIIYRVC